MFVNLARVEEGASDRVKALEEGSPRSRLQLYTKGREQAEAGDNIGCVKKKKKSASTTTVVWIARSLPLRVGGCCLA